MHTVGEIVKRQFEPMLGMLGQAILACPDETSVERGRIGPREHLYHALVGIDVWLTADPATFAFDQIVDEDASQLKASASKAVSRSYLMEYVDRLRVKVASLPDEDADFLTSAQIRGHAFTFLDRCVSQFRHVQHHIGVANVLLHADGCSTAVWQGYVEG